MFEVIVRSKTRLNLLIKFFLFDEIQGYMSGMQREFNESTNSIRTELKRLAHAGLLSSKLTGRIRFYKANPRHPLHDDLQSIVRKTVGIDKIEYVIINHTAHLDAAYLTGSFARGINSNTIELALVGNDLDKVQIERLVERTEKMTNKKIVCFTFTGKEAKYLLKDKSTQLIWKKED